MTGLPGTVDGIVSGTSHWTPAAWSAVAPGAPGESRAAVVHGLVQRLADLAAEAESAPHRPVPRLDNDLALPDQLRVVTADLLAAAPPDAVRAAALAAVTDAHHALWQ